ncbi:MAG: SRPBCC domain-containing protein, partial [Devosia sp.]|nr:SRPBCC domain-containing protein [Devosia sp.]
MTDNILDAPVDEPHFTITRSLQAPRALVYKCYTEPKHMMHFWGPRGSSLAECKIDLKVGGVWRVVWRFPDGSGFGYSSVYLEIVAPECLHYRDAPDDWTGGFDGLPPLQLLTTISLAESEQKTMVTITVRFPSVAER